MAKMKKILSLVLALCMCFSLFAVQAFADGEEGDIPSPPANTDAPVDYVAQIGSEKFVTLGAAVDYANNMTELAELTTLADGVEIQLLKDFDFDSASALTIKNDITISGAYTISRGSYTGSFFIVNSGASLTLKDLTIDGNNNWTFDEEGFRAVVESGERVNNSSVKYTTYEEGAPVASGTMITVKGKLVMDGSTIKNHVGCQLFSVESGAELVMTDATVTHNTKNGTPLVAGVSTGGKWVINAGTVISNNHTHVGNGILSYMCGTTIMNGGEIYGNTGVDCNGCVMMIYGGSSSFTMNGGRIYDNGALYGSSNGWNPAFYVYGNGAHFTMNDGTIEGNFSSSIPGIANNGSNALITLNGGKIINTVSGRGFTAKDTYAYCPVNISNEINSATNGFYNNVTNTGVLNGDSWFYSYEMTYSGGGTFNGKVTVQSGAETTMADGVWNGLTIVKAVGNDSTLTVKPDATITGIQVRVLNSVESGSYLNGEEAAAAQAAAYVEEDGANVEVPVLYYHRLTDAQKSAIVVTYDYNGGLDAQGWSGCQLTTAEEAAMADPQPTKPGYVLAGWVYASELDPESLSMAGTEDYNGEAIGKTTRLIAQWELDIPTYAVTYEYTGTVPAGAPKLPAAEYYFPGDLVSIEADENYKVADYIFSGWQDPCEYLSEGIMPAHDVTLTGCYVPVNANVDPPIGIKTDKETTGNDYEVKIEVPGDGDAVKIHDEVILIIDGSYSMDEEWEDMKANIVEIGKKVLGGAGRTQMTVISFGMDDNIVVEGIKTVDELKAMLPALPGGLLYGRSSTNCEVGFTGALNYIQSKQDELAKVDVIFISDGGVNTDETPRAFDTNWQKFSTCFGALTVVKDGICGAYDKGVDIPAMAVFGSRFDGMSKDEIIAAVVGGSVPEEELLAFGDKVWADVYAYSGLTPGKEYPISVVERAFVKYDKDKGTYVQNIFYYSTYNSKYVTYGDMYNRSVAAAEDLAASSLVDELYLLQYDNHGRGWWVKDIEDGKNYYKAENVAGLLDNVGPMLTELSNTNYKDVVITDYMSKWVLLHTDSIRIVNDTTGKTIWSIKDGWAADAEKPTTAEPPVTVEKVDPADYAAGGTDVEGNKNGDIYKITWHVKDDCLLRTDNYSLRYAVTVDVKEEGLELGKEYPANGNTDVQYIDGEGNTHKYPIDVPNVTVPAYTVTYINGKAVLQETDGLMTGDDITDYEGDTPTKAQTGNTAYRFNGWKLVEGTPDGDKIGTTDLVYEAQYKKIILNGDDYVNIPDDDIPLAPVPEVFTDDHYAYIVGYPDGSVQPGGQITRAEVATIFFRLLTEEVRQANMVSENEFSDVNPGNWFNNAVSTMAAMGIVNGYPDGSFRPNAPITRAEFAAIASRFDANASEEGDWFSDISGHWAEKAIIKAVNNGWIKGYDDGTFRPNQNITRAEAMTLVNRVLHRLPGSPADLLDDMIKWPDNADTEAWYYLAVQEATNSHHYSRETEESEFETWLEMREARDWTELEY